MKIDSHKNSFISETFSTKEKKKGKKINKQNKGKN